jgi:hypothetical protein
MPAPEGTGSAGNRPLCCGHAEGHEGHSEYAERDKKPSCLEDTVLHDFLQMPFPVFATPLSLVSFLVIMDLDFCASALGPKSDPHAGPWPLEPPPEVLTAERLHDAFVCRPQFSRAGDANEGVVRLLRTKIKAVTLALMAGSAMSGLALAQDAPAGPSNESGNIILPQNGSSGEAQSEADIQSQGATEQGAQAGASTSAGAEAQTAPSDAATATDGAAQQDADTADQPQTQRSSDGSTEMSDDAIDSSADAETSVDAETFADPDTSAEAQSTSETATNVEITTEQKTKIQSIIVEQEVEPVSIDVEVSLGTTIPKTVTLHPLPPRIIEIVPAYSGYQYFILADGRIVIVKPATYEVVYILVV